METNESSRNNCAYHDSGANRPENPKENQGSNTLRRVGIVTGGVIGSVAVAAAAPVVLTGMGFTSAGIAASSLAAKMMSAAAIANGGGVAAGGVIATLQSVGAAGFGVAGNIILAGAGAAASGHIAGKLTEPSGDDNTAGKK